MNENILIGAYWSSRTESRRQCAERITKFIKSIEDQTVYARWFVKSRDREISDKPIDIVVDAIEQRLRTNNRDTDGTAIQELGFSLAVWNGNEDTPASLVVTCGAFSKYVKNSAVLYLPPQTAPVDAASLEGIRVLLEKSIDAWDPENAVATSTEFMARNGGGMPWVTGGWAVYRRDSGLTASMFR